MFRAKATIGGVNANQEKMGILLRLSRIGIESGMRSNDEYAYRCKSIFGLRWSR
ncbi:predicted protein [Botrytis cinerea T4]|uniref:Uncharacterized protein n=1 Tax=Botryotinia fuckeliana (strain T4) TaxID=999810 RepID=G2XUR6_BOTF4|nr:predicted protein [Botrytis cinerea T4]